MSENHPSKPIRKAGPTTGELVLDRGLALHLLDQMAVIRRKHSSAAATPASRRLSARVGKFRSGRSTNSGCPSKQSTG